MINQYALGCAFSIDEILENFPYKKLKINCSECYKIIKDSHRNKLVRKVFMESLKLVINDIIDNNITFWLPLTSNRRCNIHMKRVMGTSFKQLRQHGKWQDVDITKSFFTGYEIGLFMLGNRTPRIKTVYVSKPYKDRITQKTNEGFPYGDSNKDRTIKDYYEEIQVKFPDICLQDIIRILSFCWKAVYLHNSYGGDTLLLDKDIWCYIGNMKKDPLKHFYYYIRKLTIKLRVLYKRRKVDWDGYYYFALNESQYQKYISQKKSRGRPRKYFNYGPVFLYQILDECKINEHSKQYIFRIPYITKIKIKQFIRELITDKAELIITRDPLKFKDILVYENEYEFL